MLSWVLNTPLFLKTLQTFYFFTVFYIIRLLKSLISFTKHAIKYLIIKPFDLLNTIPLTRTKALVKNLLMSKF